MTPISFKRHRFPPDVIRLGVWLYYRFTLSLRDVEDLLAERGVDVTYETVRCWANKFGPAIVANIRRKRGRAGGPVGMTFYVFEPGTNRYSSYRVFGNQVTTFYPAN